MKNVPEVFYWQHFGGCYEIRTKKGDILFCLTDKQARAAHIVRALNMHAEENSPFKECCGPLCCFLYSLGLALIGGLLTGVVTYGLSAWGRM